ncbi:MAG: hypothetical protein JSS53_00255, partial [Proteobacteria bacterium]|nr:hypothetical protein [Pseudomonadota bacterium]
GTLIQQFLKDSKFPFELSYSTLSHINGFEYGFEIAFAYRQLTIAFLKALTLITEASDINFLSTLLMYRNLIGLKLQPLSNPADGTVVSERLNELQSLFDLCSSTVVCEAILTFQKNTIEIHREALILSDITAAIHHKYPIGTTLPIPNGVKKILEILANPNDSTEDKYDKTKATIDSYLRVASIKNACSFGYFSGNKSFYTLLASQFSNYTLLESKFSEIPSNLIESSENKNGIN